MGNRMYFSVGILIIIAVILSACTNNHIVENIVIDQDTLSYSQYTDMVQNLSDQFMPPGFSNRLLPDAETTIVAVDKEASFGRRTFLTVDGEQNVQVTQKRIAYESQNESQVLFVDVIFLNEVLPKDMLYRNTHNYGKYHSDALISQVDDTILSYKNLLFKLTYFSKNERKQDLPDDTLRLSTLALVQFLENGQKNNRK